MRSFGVFGFAAAVFLATGTGPACATVFDQGTVSVSGGPANFDIITAAADVPVGSTIYLSVDGGKLLHADWFVDTRWTAEWWEQIGPDEFVKTGNDYDLSTDAPDGADPSIVFQPGHSFDVTTDLKPHRGLFEVTDHSNGFDVCADISAVPLGENCFLTGEVRHAFLSDLTVRAAHDFTWTVSDVAPVPEPGGWVLMIAGAGLAGAALRRRRLAA